VTDQREMPWGGDVKRTDLRSPDARRTERRHALLAAGRHPLIDGPVRTDGETCGSCAHLRTVSKGRDYHKCVQVRQTGGAATDVRLSWPGCKRWGGRP
jgi:hypothetical protein